MYVCMRRVRHETKRYSMDGKGIGRDFRKGGGGVFFYVCVFSRREARSPHTGGRRGGRAGDDYYNLIMPCMGMGLGLGA